MYKKVGGESKGQRRRLWMKQKRNARKHKQEKEKKLIEKKYLKNEGAF